MIIISGRKSRTVHYVNATSAVVSILLILSMITVENSSFELSTFRTESSRSFVTNGKSANGVYCLSMLNDDSKSNIETEQEQDEQKDRGLLRVEKNSGLLRLAKLSLQDYEWRVGFF
mmetsp:Transcript_10587/g.25498  ORF Transcript_10587/g.25498 Transcript_10587/m.25498 type:complete len:117 (-) Transcript_10587:3186-3536(-)